MDSDDTLRTFRSLVEEADKKFSRVRDLPTYTRAHGHAFQKVFKAYTRVWKFQQENRARLVDAGLNRWEIGEIASRIGQLYFNQYLRTSDSRFLIESYVFYEAIVRRKYFEDDGAKKVKGKELVGLRFKELRFYARFLVVCLIIDQTDLIRFLVDRFRSLVEDCKSRFRETNFKEWKFVLQDISRFIEVNSSFTKTRPLRYSVAFDSHSDSRLHVARFHSKKVQKFTDSILTSYHRNEVKFAEITLDTYRMAQCLEWEPSFFNDRLSENSCHRYPIESNENGIVFDNSGPSGAIDMKLTADLSDPTQPSNPRKSLLYRPSVTHLLSVLATVCEELPPESIMLLYLSASGKVSQLNNPTSDAFEGVRSSSNSMVSGTCSESVLTIERQCNGKADSSGYYDSYLWFGPKKNGDMNMLYPGDIIPFTRKPLFLIIDSDNSHAFKVLHGVERGETTALMLSHLKPAFNTASVGCVSNNGSQFTCFLTAPIQAFCQMFGLPVPDCYGDHKDSVEEILSTAFSEWEIILCTSKNLDIVWAQVLSDIFLRRIILRFIFCRSVLSLFWNSEDDEPQLPLCLPRLPQSVSPRSDAVQSAVYRIAKRLDVVDYFHFNM